LVVHRGEYTETVGFQIIVRDSGKKFVFLPDIDSWFNFEEKIFSLVRESDYVFIDATFYCDSELKCRDMSKVPHPRVIQSIELFTANLEHDELKKIYFIHFNHTNPLLDPSSEESKLLMGSQFHLAEEGSIFYL